MTALRIVAISHVVVVTVQTSRCGLEWLLSDVQTNWMESNHWIGINIRYLETDTKTGPFLMKATLHWVILSPSEPFCLTSCLSVVTSCLRLGALVFEWRRHRDGTYSDLWWDFRCLILITIQMGPTDALPSIEQRDVMDKICITIILWWSILWKYSFIIACISCTSSFNLVPTRLNSQRWCTSPRQVSSSWKPKSHPETAEIHLRSSIAGIHFP